MLIYCCVGGQGQSSSSAGNPHPQAKRGNGKSGFFASLHPSRWTRGGGSTSASSNSNNNQQSGASTQAERTHHVQLPTAVGNPVSTNRGNNLNAFLAASYKEQVKSWLKEQSLLFTSKYCRKGADVTSVSGNSISDDLGVLPKLTSIITNLRSVS